MAQAIVTASVNTNVVMASLSILLTYGHTTDRLTATNETAALVLIANVNGETEATTTPCKSKTRLNPWRFSIPLIIIR
jgi:hypothetical protein